MTTVPEELPGRAGLLAALGGGFTAASLLLHTPLRAPLTAVLAPLGRTALGAGILAAQAVLSPLWLGRFRYGPMEWLWRCVTWWRWMPVRAREVRATT